MDHHPRCPSCSAQAWREIGARTYSPAAAAGMSDYVRMRHRVLFEVWHPGLAELRVHALLCRSCGLIILRPRPDCSDLDAKYAFLNRFGPDCEPAGGDAVGRARAREIFGVVGRLSGRSVTGGRVLDFGGGDGRLMEPFRDVGCRCEVVDYTTRTVPGVIRIGDTLRDLTDDRRYDWIIASHVIEHVADPLGEIRTLREHLLPDGILFVEVPMEIWGRPPLPEEPVTHLNFFTRSSLRFLVEAAGLEVLQSRLASSLHPTNTRFASIQVVARRSGGTAPPTPPGPREAEEFLSADPIHRIRCALQCPGAIAGAVRRRLRRVWNDALRSP